MIKLSLIGIAAVVATAAFAAPAFAQHRAAHVANAYAQTANGQVGVCGYQEPGNPWSQSEDYMAWSAWRARGGWDDRVDTDCLNGRVGRGGF